MTCLRDVSIPSAVGQVSTLQSRSTKESASTDPRSPSRIASTNVSKSSNSATRSPLPKSRSSASARPKRNTATPLNTRCSRCPSAQINKVDRPYFIPSVLNRSIYDHTDTRYSLRLNFSSGQYDVTTVRLLQTRPEIPCLAFLACVMYLNFTNTFPTLGGAYPQIMSGLGMTTISTGPYFLHYSCASHSKSSTKSSSNRSSGQHMLSSWSTLLGILQVGSLIRVSWMSMFVMFSQERRQDPNAWLAGLMIVSCSPPMFVGFGVKPKLRPLLPKLAEWHFSFLSPRAMPFKPFIAFSPHACSSYSKKQQPLDTPPSLTRLKNFSFPKVSQIFLTCSSLNDSGNPPKQILLSDPMLFRSFFLRYFSWKNSLGFTILKVFSLQLNQGCVLKKSFTRLDDRVMIANVLALSNSTSLIGKGMASSGLEAAMTVLKY